MNIHMLVLYLVLTWTVTSARNTALVRFGAKSMLCASLVSSLSLLPKSNCDPEFYVYHFLFLYDFITPNTLIFTLILSLF